MLRIKQNQIDAEINQIGKKRVISFCIEKMIHINDDDDDNDDKRE